MIAANPTATIPRTTLNNALAAKKKALDNTTSGDGKYEMFARPHEHHNKQDASVLTTKEDRDLLQSIAKSRDEMNRGMTRKEMISLISTLFSVSNKAAENHFDYLVRQKKFPELKRNISLRLAQICSKIQQSWLA